MILEMTGEWGGVCLFVKLRILSSTYHILKYFSNKYNIRTMYTRCIEYATISKKIKTC